MDFVFDFFVGSLRPVQRCKVYEASKCLIGSCCFDEAVWVEVESLALSLGGLTWVSGVVEKDCAVNSRESVEALGLVLEFIVYE